MIPEIIKMTGKTDFIKNNEVTRTPDHPIIFLRLFNSSCCQRLFHADRENNSVNYVDYTIGS